MTKRPSKPATDLKEGDIVVRKAGDTATVERVRIDDDDDDVTVTYQAGVVDVFSSGVMVPLHVTRKRAAPAAAAAPAPEPPAKRTRRSMAQVEREALQRGIQLGLERAARLNVLNTQADQTLGELEKAVSEQGMSVPGALARAFSAGKQYEVERIGLDKA